MRHDACHIGLECQHDKIEHQLDVLAHAVASLRLDAHGLFVETRPAALQDAFAVAQPAFHFADRFQVLVQAAAVGDAERALEVADAFAGRVEDAAIQFQPGLRVAKLVPIGRRKQTLEDVAMIRGRGDVNAEGVARQGRRADAVREREGQRRQPGGAQMPDGNLVHRNGVGDRAGREIDVVAGQPVVGMHVSADASLNVQQVREHGEIVAMPGQRLVGRRKGVIAARVARKPAVAIDGAGNVEASKKARFALACLGVDGRASHDFQVGQSDGGAEAADEGSSVDRIFRVHRGLLTVEG